MKYLNDRSSEPYLDASHFVLRYDKNDKHARKAMLAYADSVENENTVLANDIRKAVVTTYLDHIPFILEDKQSNDDGNA